MSRCIWKVAPKPERVMLDASAQAQLALQLWPHSAPCTVSRVSAPPRNAPGLASTRAPAAKCSSVWLARSTSGVTRMYQMFRNAAAFNQPVPFDTSKCWRVLLSATPKVDNFLLPCAAGVAHPQ